MPAPVPGGLEDQVGPVAAVTAAVTESLSEVAVTATAATTVSPIVSASAVAADAARAARDVAGRHPPAAARAGRGRRAGPSPGPASARPAPARRTSSRWRAAWPTAGRRPPRSRPARRRPASDQRPPGDAADRVRPRRLAGTASRSASTGATRVAAQAGSERGDDGDHAARRPGRPRRCAARWPAWWSGPRRRSASSSDADAGRQADADEQPERRRRPARRPRPRRGRRRAPVAGSRRPRAAAPTSRRRWATSTLKVFQMTKEPDQQRDAGEDQQHRGEDASRVAHGRRAVGGDLLARQRLDAVRAAPRRSGRAARRG